MFAASPSPQEPIFGCTILDAKVFGVVAVVVAAVAVAAEKDVVAAAETTAPGSTSVAASDGRRKLSAAGQDAAVGVGRKIWNRSKRKRRLKRRGKVHIKYKRNVMGVGLTWKSRKWNHCHVFVGDLQRG